MRMCVYKCINALQCFFLKIHKSIGSGSLQRVRSLEGSVIRTAGCRHRPGRRLTAFPAQLCPLPSH